MFANPNIRLAKFADLFSYSLLLLNIFLLPVFLDSRLANFYVLPKQYLFFGLVLLNLFFWCLKTVVLKKIIFRHSVIDWLLLGILAVALFSSVFSAGISDSFLGRPDYFGISFILLAFSIIFYFVIVNLLDNSKKWQLAVDVLLISGGITSAMFLLKGVFDFSLPWLGGVWNTVDNSNSGFGIWLIFNLAIAGGLVMQRNCTIGRSLAYFLLVLLNCIALLVLGFSFLWWILLVGLGLLLMVGFVSMSEARTGWLTALFVLLILTIVFITFGSPKSVQFPLPSEVSLATKISWNITSDTIFAGVKNFLLGSGPGTFGVDFSQFKPIDFNYNQLAWSVRFNQPINTLLALLAEGGVIVSLGFVFLLLLVIGYSVHALYGLRKIGLAKNAIRLMKANEEMNIPLFVLLIGWLVLCIGLATTFVGPVLWWLWWLVLGLMVSGLYLVGNVNILKNKVWAWEETPQHNLVFSFGTIVVMATVVMIGVLGVRFYMAEYNYNKAFQSNDYNAAESMLNKAVQQRGSLDIYHVALARTYLLQASDEAQKSEAQVNSVAGLMAKAVESAKRATDLSPKSSTIWDNLAMMYDNASLLVPGAKDWAVKSLQQAVELEPNNPVWQWRLGNIYARAGDFDKAVENYKKALEFKNDYVAAYVSLAAVYEQQKDLDKAIETYSIIIPAYANNPEALFNLGRLFYNRQKKGDWDNAEKLWLEAVRIQKDYSNALYSLGLLYEMRSNNANALEYYYRVKELNPGNNDIISKIKSLVGSAVD